MVNQGLRTAAVCWAFSATHGANWHPLTSLSHMLDCSLFDLNPTPMHWESVLLHLVNTGLVFWVWRRLSARANGTDPTWPSAFVAALFALHPLHVESVAWISERKDVLSTALWLCTILAYLRWVERPSPRRYTLVAGLFVLGLMAKPMLTTLPCTLLLLDYWPLRRWPALSWRALFWEKIPLFAIVGVHGVVTMLVQRALGATDYGENFTLWMRIGNALISYTRYLGKMLWPQTLSPFYPHPGSWPLWAVLGAATLIAAVSWLVWRERERRRWLLFGWCWYLGTLVPVIGILQVGAQGMADRYTYVSLLGIFTILAWGGAELIARRPALRVPLTVVAAVVLAACAVRTFLQVPIWKTPIGLVEHMRRSIGDHEIVYRELAMAFIIEGRTEEEVVAIFKKGREVRPDYPYFMNELGMRAAAAKRFGEARALLEMVLEHLPHDPAAHANFGNMAAMEGKLDEAERRLRKAIEIRPGLGGAHRLLADVLVKQGRKVDARDSFEAAVRADRWDWIAWNQLGIIEAGNHEKALATIKRALWINPADEGVRHNLDYLQKHVVK
jgi:Flp pilus assembly protein TadD